MDVQQPIFYSGGVGKKLLRCDVFKNQAAEGGISLEVLPSYQRYIRHPGTGNEKDLPSECAELNTIE